MARVVTSLGTFGLALLLIGNASACLIPFSPPTAPSVTFSTAHFRHSSSFCTVGFGGSRIPTEAVRWLGEPNTANQPSASLRAAMSAHGRFYHGQTYRADAVYLVQPESFARRAAEGDLDRRNLGMFVQVIVSLGSESRFEFELLYDFDSDRLADAVDVIAFVDVDVQAPATDGAPTPYYAGLNPAMPASFGAIQHAMGSWKGGLGPPGNGIGYGWGGFPSDLGGYFAPEEDYAFNWDLSDLQDGIAQQNLEGSAPDNFDAAPEPSSLAVFCGLGVLALWSAWLRKGKRKPA
jgi:hypothetical protein